MDYITARERALLQFLLKKDEEVPVSVMARDLEVSTRTIHRDLKALDSFLTSRGLAIKKSTGKGVSLTGTKENMKELSLQLLQQSPAEYTAEERRILEICTLLESKEPIKLTALAIDLKVTAATISHDLDRLEDWLSFFELTLTRRRGSGVQLEGSETAKRRAMSSVIAENFREEDFFSMIRKNIDDKRDQEKGEISNRLLGMVEEDKWSAVEEALSLLSEELPYSFADSAYIGLVVHLTLAVERIEQGQNIDMNPEFLNSLEMTKEFTLAGKITSRLEQVFQIIIPKAETGYITMHLRGAKLRQDQEFILDTNNLPAAVYAKKLMRYIQEETGVFLTGEGSLYEGLVSHLEPTLYRLQENMKIHNPLLQEIKRDYPDLFKIVEKAAGKAFGEIMIPEAEIGFLALHFGAALERSRQQQTIKALVVCSSGIGSSKMLLTRIEREIPELAELKNISMMEIEEERSKGFDLIISTLPLSGNEPHIVVNPFLSEDDIENIRSYIERINKTKQQQTYTEKQHSRPPADPFHQITKIERYSRFINELLKHLRLGNIQETSQVRSGLKQACLQLEKNGKLQDGSAVAEKMWDRHESSGVGIPGSHLALFHTRSPYVRQPSFTLWELPEPQSLQAMDGSQIEVSRLLVLLAPEKEVQELYEILSAVSSQLIENDYSIKHFTYAGQESIRRHMASAFHQWLKNKISST
ncbi:BglG family transcription antiterminator [Alteribacillus sp. HJP-4]|uniref:BglG family transcription antiterminator n=1 Tax=Alteribacillus sp. HJP-4 TaxID=2775394 RepID=UPI0035CD2FBC